MSLSNENEPEQINVKPFSVNQAWQGRRFRTTLYKEYEEVLLEILEEDIEIPKDVMLGAYFEWGFSTAAADWDNPIKPFQDVLQKKYGFNDNKISMALVRKKKVKRGEEYIRFKIVPVKRLASFLYEVFMELIRS